MIVVGINPADRFVGAKLPRGHSLARLAEWCRAAGLSRVSFVNTHHEPGPSRRMRDVDAEFLLACMAPGYDVVLALGEFPSRVLTRLHIDHHRLPHPSGRNRLLNDRAFARRVVRELRSVVHS